MGNLTSQTRQQHYIENIDEHATSLMSELALMRGAGSFCDITSESSRFQPAHSVILSFNQHLLQVSVCFRYSAKLIAH